MHIFKEAFILGGFQMNFWNVLSVSYPSPYPSSTLPFPILTPPAPLFHFNLLYYYVPSPLDPWPYKNFLSIYGFSKLKTHIWRFKANNREWEKTCDVCLSRSRLPRPEHEEIKLLLTLKLHPYWLALIELKCAVYAMEDKRNPWSHIAVNLENNSKNQTNTRHLPIDATVAWL